MKLSQLSTDRALDVLCEITPYIVNITSDEKVIQPFVGLKDFKDMTKIALFIATIERYSVMLPVVLKTHREDVYGILSVVNEKTPEEIGAQSLIETMSQFKEVFQDEEFLTFFKSFMPQKKTG